MDNGDQEAEKARRDTRERAIRAAAERVAQRVVAEESERVRQVAVAQALAQQRAQVVAESAKPAAPTYQPGDYVCMKCGALAAPLRRSAGSDAVEWLLWLCLIVPGYFYHAWRKRAELRICASCKSLEVVPAESARGRVALGERP